MTLNKDSSAVHIAVILTDADRRIQWVNADFTNITGFTLQDVYGKKPGTVLQGPDTEPEVVDRIRHSLTAAVSLCETITNYRKNGEPYPCRLVIHPIFNDSGELVNFIAFEVDASKPIDAEHLPLLNPPVKYRSSSLHSDKGTKLFAALTKLMKEEKIYLDASLTLSTLANELNTNNKYLSQVINSKTGCNFHSYVNAFRVKDTEVQLLDNSDSHLTLYGIASRCGFNNKSTFYKVFKEITGCTPNEYVNRNRDGN